MRILITGTTGWLGSELAKALVIANKNNAEKNHEIYGLARRPTVIDGVISLIGDITSKVDMERLFGHDDPTKEKLEDVLVLDVIVHLAGVAGWCTIQQGMETNVVGTQNLIAATRKEGHPQKYILASSVAVTGTCTPNCPPPSLPITNQQKFIPKSPWAYALSKSVLEDVIAFIGTTDTTTTGDYLLIRIGAVVTDPINLSVPLKHFETAINEEITIQPADITVEPKQKETFPEFPLCAIALSDILQCFQLAIDSPHIASRAQPPPNVDSNDCHSNNVRIITAVGPTAYTKQPVADVLTSWYGERQALNMDLTYHRIPGNEFAPIYDIESAKQEIGFVANIDLRKEMGLVSPN